jgi:hypothetical protein
MAASELLDHRGHARAVADALRGMWRDVCAGGPAEATLAATGARQVLPGGNETTP